MSHPPARGAPSAAAAPPALLAGLRSVLQCGGACRPPARRAARGPVRPCVLAIGTPMELLLVRLCEGGLRGEGGGGRRRAAACECVRVRGLARGLDRLWRSAAWPLVRVRGGRFLGRGARQAGGREHSGTRRAYGMAPLPEKQPVAGGTSVAGGGPPTAQAAQRSCYRPAQPSHLAPPPLPIPGAPRKLACKLNQRPQHNPQCAGGTHSPLNPQPRGNRGGTPDHPGRASLSRGPALGGKTTS